ncbi:hypothetical protein FRC07_004397 [Ceratobasidium sp. 392]|nr:hypothetical protein FRC07_004397 [Ceratobasidium sp. 392]
MELLGAANTLLAKPEVDTACSVLKKTWPIVKQLKAHWSVMQTKLKALEENTVKVVEADARNMLGTTLADVT